MFIDTHAHLDFKDFTSDLAETLTRAREAGVGKIINVGSSLTGSRDSAALASAHEMIYASVGIHPHDAGEATQDNLVELAMLARQDKVVAIGEIGLDYFRSKTSPELQKESFQRQLDLAAEIGKPVIIHARDAEDDVLDILRRYRTLNCVIHFFSGSPDFASFVVTLGYLVSFTGVVTYKPRSPGSGSGAEYDALRSQIITGIPADRLMIETDCPFAAPEPYRGKRSEPAHVIEIARKLSEIRGVPLKEIEQTTTANAERFFGI